jgi:hypothetical protein
MNTTDLKKLAKCSDKGHRVHQALEHSHSGVHVAEKNLLRNSKCCEFVRFSPRLLKSRLVMFSHLSIGAGHEK